MTTLDLQHYTPAPDLLDGRIVLITGAGDGIGRALAEACAAHGATVVLLDKSIKLLERTYDAIEAAGGPKPAIYPLNLEGASPTDYDTLAENLRVELGGLHALVHNAGWIGSLTPFKLYSPELWARVLTVNLHAPFMLTQSCLPLLEAAPDASIVFSTHSCTRAYWGGFGVAKAGLAGMLGILAHEYDIENGIRVNGVDTGPVRTPMRTQHYPGENRDRLPRPEAVTAPYLYFLGPDSLGVTGTEYRMDLTRN
jgi:NAD(P)-dependent dehydrogenase (short-subunit alcohol dehydrogenase family)